MEIKITKVTERGNNVFLLGSDGEDYSGFKLDKAQKPTGLSALREGDVIEAEIKVNGKYNNIVSFKKIEQKAEPNKATAGVKDNPERPNLNARSFALSYAKDYGIPLKLTPDEIIEVARKFDAYLNGK